MFAYYCWRTNQAGYLVHIINYTNYGVTLVPEPGAEAQNFGNENQKCEEHFDLQRMKTTKKTTT
jgi:hypothetical protein